MPEQLQRTATSVSDELDIGAVDDPRAEQSDEIDYLDEIEDITDETVADLPPQTFTELGLDSRLLEAVAAMGYDKPTQIQERAIPMVLAGNDIVGCSQTGTGKTAAFVLPIVQRINGHNGDAPSKHIKALVVTPTRELAAQIEAVAVMATKSSGLRALAVYGGTPYDPQARQARKGVDVLVATPGRLLDMMRQGDIKLDHVQVLVLDEADRMLDMGFWPDVRRIVRALPEKRQNLLFSATMSKGVLSVIGDALSRPVFIEVGGRATPIEAIDQKVMPVDGSQKLELLIAYLQHHGPERVLVFTRTKHRAERLALTMHKRGINSTAIHGNRNQVQREKALQGFKSGRYKVLIATDIVARGIDVEGISHVINYDVPSNPEDYVHRIGRTARAGASGIAISLLSAEEVYELKDIERLIGMEIPREDLPDFDYIKRTIPETKALPRRPGKLVYNGGARRAMKFGVRRKPVKK
jgi:ATP-dependent RNA helicase RhlE